MYGFSDELTDFIFSVENSVLVCKSLGELHEIIQWLFENITEWKTIQPEPDHLEDLWNNSLPGFIYTKSVKYWKIFDFQHYWLNRTTFSWRYYGFFKFQNPNDAMLFKLRWA